MGQAHNQAHPTSASRVRCVRQECSPSTRPVVEYLALRFHLRCFPANGGVHLAQFLLGRLGDGDLLPDVGRLGELHPLLVQGDDEGGLLEGPHLARHRPAGRRLGVWTPQRPGRHPLHHQLLAPHGDGEVLHLRAHHLVDAQLSHLVQHDAGKDLLMSQGNDDVLRLPKAVRPQRLRALALRRRTGAGPGHHLVPGEAQVHLAVAHRHHVSIAGHIVPCA